MSQGQPRRDQEQQQHDEGINYGDVFPVSGDLAGQTVAPHDAAIMQSADNLVLGETQKGDPTSTMQSTSVDTRNERAGVVGHDHRTDFSQDINMVVSQHIAPGPGDAVTAGPGGGYRGGLDNQGGGGDGGIDSGGNVDPIKITIGACWKQQELRTHDKPVEQSDSAAIQAAEARAIGLNVTMPGGVAAQAQSAADANLWATRDEDKAKLSDVLSDAAGKLPADKPVEKDDAARVVGAEIHNKEDARTTPGGVAATMAAASRLNEGLERAT